MLQSSTRLDGLASYHIVQCVFVKVLGISLSVICEAGTTIVYKQHEIKS